MGLLSNDRNWRIVNTDTGEEVEGDFEAEAVTREISSTYAESSALGAQDAITQFLHGNVDTLSFSATFFADSILGRAGLNLLGGTKTATEKFDKLEEWTRVDPTLARPPVVLFSIGDGTVHQTSIIESLSGISYGPLGASGEVKQITLTVNLRKFVELDIEAELTAAGPPESRFHRVKQGEYMELIAEREYKRPLLGDVIRKRHPKLQVLTVGDTVKLPSFEAIRRVPVVPGSVPLKGLTKKKESPQTRLRDLHLQRLNRRFTSLVLPEGL